MGMGNVSTMVFSITVITYVFVEAFKAVKMKKEMLPVCAMAIGGIFGIVGYWVIPEYPAGNLMDAVAVGVISGLSSTGAHQIYKQKTKG